MLDTYNVYQTCNKYKYIVAQFINIQESMARWKPALFFLSQSPAQPPIQTSKLSWGKCQFQCLYLVDVIQFGTRPAAIVRFLPEPLGANFDTAAAGLAAARPVGPFTEFTVWGAGNDARLFNISWKEHKKGCFRAENTSFSLTINVNDYSYD